MTETWKPVVGFDGYEVSDEGRVRSLDRVVMRRNGAQFTVKGRVLVRRLSAAGAYPEVKLRSPGRSHTALVHVLMAEAFLGGRPNGADLRHLDGDRANTSLANLAYGSRTENLLDAVRHGTHFNARKTHCAQGHEFTPENTYRRPSKPRSRVCRACKAAQDARAAA